MELIITARHFDLDNEVKEFSEGRILPLKRFFDRIIEADLVLLSEKHRQIAELTLNIPGGAIVAKAESKDIFESIDKTVAKVERQLIKRKDMMTDHKGPDHLTREQLLNPKEDTF